MELHYGMLCCQCGAPIEANPSSMCVQCLKQHVDITEGIDCECNLLFCRQCERYSLSGDKFVPAELESPQLLGLCLKRIRGLKGCRIIDSRFIWTEPHSKRIKLNLILQKEVLNGTIVEQQHLVTFTIVSTMCEECQYTYTNHTWNWSVQVRQKVVHKRTFLYLENEIIQQKSKFHFVDIQKQSEGIDFYFTEKAACFRFVDFLHARAPGEHSITEKLVSADVKSNVANKKRTVLFQIAALCKDDLVVVPKKLRQYVGSLNRICLVYKVAQRIHLVDPISGETGALTAAQYFSAPFTALRTRKQRIDGTVLYKEDNGAYIQSEDDAEQGDQHYCYTHLAGVLNDEQKVWMYNAESIDFGEIELPKGFRCEQKYYLIARAQRPSQQRVKKVRDQQLSEDEVPYEQDDVDAVAELYESDQSEPEVHELAAEEVYADLEGYCPQ